MRPARRGTVRRGLCRTRSEPAARNGPVSPRAKPWTGPSAEEARPIFRAEETLRLTPVRRERFFATAFAERGIGYPYRYPGDQFAAPGASA
ncbi:hypothetical protein SCWH03_31740 [Streptomyces pacificus]|uniref:Uncharacterized protein n=1 Tax=Streptomyces pacificus TaxID=2705029 RepID=A0A6A0AX68_9ACTN|nr:hypothetical protein SCWH03_31740 [Streptomyces pacificus]